ncbi:DUF4224 domain-containing protein [Paraburkholderia panacisoli]|uniref:DUF4224 domain-containing protein n=2 Tax=Paraburkholderia panacisoli TaxID=2603818 RepID=A0A5B0HD33_9BURK|nr:DUF4224 domain-containing protein [Paraburkholderia panacisoli]
MASRLMSPGDLVEITGKRRYSKQAEWFKDQFGVTVTQRDDRSIVMTWSTYEALAARKVGLATNGDGPGIVELCFD